MLIEKLVLDTGTPKLGGVTAWALPRFGANGAGVTSPDAAASVAPPTKVARRVTLPPALTDPIIAASSLHHSSISKQLFRGL
jgi:hypothetical protein